MTCKCHRKPSTHSRGGSLLTPLEHGMAEGVGWALAAIVVAVIIRKIV